MGADKDHPYLEAVVGNGLGFLSDCLPSTSNVPPGAGQLELLDAAVKTMERRLKSVGGTLDDVVKLTYLVTDISMREAANKQYLGLWDEPRPARTVIGMAVPPYNKKLEIDAIARQP
jgi:enamine deaminase RidA (YjgF/YER057c/UK114 family)